MSLFDVDAAQIAGMLLAALAGGGAVYALNRLWRASRAGLLGAPLLGALSAAAASAALQLVGAGELRFTAPSGQIHWPPVISTLGAGAACGLLAAVTLTLLRRDAYVAKPLGAAWERSLGAVRQAAPYAVLAVGVAVLAVLAAIRHGALAARDWAARATGAMGARRVAVEGDRSAGPPENEPPQRGAR